jgi:hypothetical protein
LTQRNSPLMREQISVYICILMHVSLKKCTSEMKMAKFREIFTWKVFYMKWLIPLNLHTYAYVGAKMYFWDDNSKFFEKYLHEIFLHEMTDSFIGFELSLVSQRFLSKTKWHQTWSILSGKIRTADFLTFQGRYSETCSNVRHGKLLPM